jgi:hypothetical protein
MQMPFMAKDHNLGLYDDGVLVANLKGVGLIQMKIIPPY